MSETEIPAAELSDKRVEEFAGGAWPAYAREIAGELLRARREVKRLTVVNSLQENRVSMLLKRLRELGVTPDEKWVGWLNDDHREVA